MANELVMKHCDSDIIAQMEKDTEKALQLVIENVNELSTVEQMYSAIGRSALVGRAQWVQTALICAKAFKDKSAKEMSALQKEFEKTLRYSRAQLYNYRKAGNELLKPDHKPITMTLNEYLARPSAAKVEYKEIQLLRLCGSYKDGSGIEQNIILAHFDDGDESDESKSAAIYITIPKPQCEKLSYTQTDKGSILTPQDEPETTKSGTQKVVTHWYCDGREITFKKTNL